ncbi:MAG: sulfatase-like hydrolase/transferase [Verrucomicrobiota bacterium]
MNRMRFFLAALTSLLFGGLLCADAPPNIVYLISDDQTFSDFGFMGHPEVLTPNLDRLSRKSAVYKNGYVPSSVCRPSLVTLLTGLYPHQHSVHFNHPPPGFSKLTKDPKMTKSRYDELREAGANLITVQPSLPRILAQNGYRCFQTGKYWEGHWRNARFTEGMTLNKASSAKHGNKTLPNGEVVAHGNGDAGLAIGRETMKPIFRFLDQCGTSQPFFLWYAPFLPHTPHDSPERFFELYENRPGVEPHQVPYFASISQFDETVGTLLSALEERGQLENTLIVFVVDNGWSPDQNKPKGSEFNHTNESKRAPFDDGVRTPILLSWPGKTVPASHDGLVSSIDLMPTALRAAGIDPPAALPGVNLLPSAKGQTPLDPTRAVFGAIYPGDASVLGDPAKDVAYRWVRQGDLKLIAPTRQKPWGSYVETNWLSNLADDPGETTNLTSEPEFAADHLRLKKLLDDWWDP